MSKRQIEVEDDLSERVSTACDEVADLLKQYLEDNPDADETPDLGNDLDYSGGVHEIVDSSVPIYTYHIEGLWFLYGREFEQAYDDAGVGDNPKENDGMAAIYFYIDAKVREWYSDNADDLFEAWQEAKTAKETADAPPTP